MNTANQIDELLCWDSRWLCRPCAAEEHKPMDSYDDRLSLRDRHEDLPHSGQYECAACNDGLDFAAFHAESNDIATTDSQALKEPTP